MEIINSISLEAYIIIGIVVSLVFGYGFKLIREQYVHQKSELNKYKNWKTNKY